MHIRKLFAPALAVILLLGWVALAGEKTLYQKQSPYNLIVVTEDDQGLRTLSFGTDGVRQSVVKVGDPDHLELPYARVMVSALALCQQPKRILVVGLGGGTIPCFLHKHYPKTQIDVVDIDPGVVEAAKRFFDFREDATMRAYVQDGRRFIEARPRTYDLIFLDAFGSENIPYHLTTQQFLQAVRRALTPDGLAVGNIWSRASNPLYDAMVRTYQEVFDELYILDVPYAGNKILIALPRKMPIGREELASRAEAVAKKKGFRFDLGELVRYGYQWADQKDPRVRVLTDKPGPSESPSQPD